MKRSVVSQLVVRDLQRYRWMIFGMLLAGVLSLMLSTMVDGDSVSSGINIGLLLYITSIIVFGILMVMQGVLKERHAGSWLFVLSLPVTATQYVRAKSVAVLLAFLLPWLLLTAGVVLATCLAGKPMGGMPFFIALMLLFLVNFSLLLAVVVLTWSELWAVLGILLTNLSVTLFLTKLGSLPAVAGRAQEAAMSWSPLMLWVIGIEIALILLALALALALPSRRQDAF